MAARPKQSSVWNYFKYQKETNKSVCQVLVIKNGEEDSICGTELSGMYASNLKKHLKIQHSKAYQKFEEEESKRTVSKRNRATCGTFTSQQTIQESFKHNWYSEGSKKQIAITKKLSLFVGATNVPLSLVDCPEFRDLLKEMDKQYKIPYRKKLGHEIDKVYSNLKIKISEVLDEAKRLSICCDVWSKKGMTASFLGVTVHCFANKQRHNITLAVRRFEQPHTGVRVAGLLQEIVDEWKIPHHKVFRSLTDNGSNMVKAFKVLQSNEEDSNNHLSDPDELENDDTSEDSDDDIEDDENFQKACADEIQQYEDNEDDHSTALVGWRRCSCFTHSLQLVVKVFEKTPCFKKTINKTYKIVKKFNMSCKATEKLVTLAGKKLVANCPTRWDSMFLMISRFVSLREHITSVLDDLGWDGLSISQWKQLQSVLQLLQPFAQQTNVASSENTTSIAMVIPILKELDLHLKEMTKPQSANLPTAVVAARIMYSALRTRFKFVYDTYATNFDGIYVTAAFLNPGYRGILDEEQVTKAKEFLMDHLDMNIEMLDEENSSEVENTVTDEEDGPPLKRFKHLNRVSEYLKRKEEEKKTKTDWSSEEEEIERYTNTKHTSEELKLDPLVYWINVAGMFPKLSDIACDIMCTPASSAPVERAFSVSGEATCGKRNRLVDYNLERETLLRKNKQYM